MRGEVRPGRRREVVGDRGASRAQGRLDCRFGAGHGKERTPNMRGMFVTLDVSKVSGWLNAVADCRVERRGVRCGARCAGREAGARMGQYRRKWYARGIGPTEAGGQGVVSAPETCRTCS